MHAPLTPEQSRGHEIEAFKMRAYHDKGLVVVSVADPRLSWIEREILYMVATRFFGQRRRFNNGH